MIRGFGGAGTVGRNAAKVTELAALLRGDTALMGVLEAIRSLKLADA